MKINDIVASWLRSYRAERGLTLDQIATASHKYESGWTSATLSHMESGGSKADSLETLLILLATLNDLNRDDLRLSDIFIDCDAVEVGDGFEESGGSKADSLETLLILLATLNDLNRDDLRLSDIFIDCDAVEVGDGFEVDEDGFFNALGGRPVDIADPFEHARLIPLYATLAETRLANRSGVDSEALHEACMNLYGHSLDEEAAKRAGEGATPQKRGRMTRVLADEILDYMRKVAAKLED